VAFSLGLADTPDYRAAGKVAACVIPWAFDAPAPLTLNVNVPSGDVDAVRGVRHAPLASFGTVDTQVTEIDQGQVVVSYREIDPSGEPDRDAALLAQGFATVTALLPGCEATGIGLDGLVGDVESATS
jgi:5'-nucleotidase